MFLTLLLKIALIKIIQSRLNLGNSCYLFFQNILPHLCCPKSLKLKDNYTITFVLCGFETWSFTLREEYRLRMFENRALKMAFWD